MGTLLLVDGQTVRRNTLRDALASAGHLVTLASDGAFALTLLERSPHDAAVCAADLSDMTGLELIDILRSDPTTQHMRCVLLAAPGFIPPEGSTPQYHGIVREGEPQLAKRIGDIVGGHRSQTPPEAPPLFQGKLAVMGVPELAQAIAFGRRTGALEIELLGGTGRLVFLRGRPVHAELLGLTGLPALARLVAGGEREPDATFAFREAGSDAIDETHPTLTGSVESLLLSVASSLDEGTTPALTAAAHSQPEAL